MPSVDFAGESFRTAEKVGHMALLRFAHAAKKGIDTDDLDGLAAMYELLEQCLHEDDWEPFQRAALRSKASGDELMHFVAKVGGALRGKSTPEQPAPAVELFPAAG